MAPTINLFVSLITLLFLQQTAAHFLLHLPPTIGFDDNLEGEAPCGSFSVDFSTDNVTNYHVGGDTIALTSIHPQATWLFRATLDTKASGNWTTLLPAIQQTGLGDYCEPSVAVPASWAGSKGVIGIVQDAPDGILYQCAAVNFVTGTQTTVPSVCVNGTGLTATFTADAVLSSLPASFVSTATATATGTASTSASTSSSTVKSAATTIHSSSYAAWGVFGWVATLGAATMVACLL